MGFRQVLGGLLRFAAPHSLIEAQKRLSVEPVVTLTIGSHTLDDYVMAYKYEEVAEEIGSLAIWLDNRDGNFDDLSTDWPELVRGVDVDLRRGTKITGTPTTEKLPDCWVDTYQYVYDDGAAMLLLDCLDWRGKLSKFRYATDQTWSNTNIKTIAASMLGEVGLTLASGSFGFSIDHEVETGDDLHEALTDLMDKVDEFLYTGLDGEIQFKTLASDEAAGYIYDWVGGANHPLMNNTEVAQSSAEFNKITVIGGANEQYSGSAEDTTESALVGTRQRVITDTSLGSNAECLERAQGELSFWQSRKVAGILVARPHFTLRLYDVVEVKAPPWGGPDLATARVTAIVETFGFGRWQQEITIGDLPEQSLLHTESRPGRSRSGSRSRSRRRRRRRRRRYAYRDHTHEEEDLELDYYSLADLLEEDGAGSGLDADLLDGSHLADIDQVPSGLIAMWSGAVVDIPTGWALCDGNNGTPDLRGSFIVGAGGSYSVSDTGGQDTADLSHAHDPGTLNTASDQHRHDSGTYSTDTDTHAHDFPQPESTEGPSATTTAGTGSAVTVPTSTHTHPVPNFGTEDDGHSHDVQGYSGYDTHDHDVDSGATASGGEAAHDNRPVYYALAFIMKT